MFVSVLPNSLDTRLMYWEKKYFLLHLTCSEKQELKVCFTVSFYSGCTLSFPLCSAVSPSISEATGHNVEDDYADEGIEEGPSESGDSSKVRLIDPPLITHRTPQTHSCPFRIPQNHQIRVPTTRTRRRIRTISRRFPTTPSLWWQLRAAAKNGKLVKGFDSWCENSFDMFQVNVVWYLRLHHDKLSILSRQQTGMAEFHSSQFVT